jgi:hypothetical protein
MRFFFSQTVKLRFVAQCFLSKSIGSTDLGKTGLDLMYTTDLRLVSRLKMNKTISAPLHALMACRQKTLPYLFVIRRRPCFEKTVRVSLCDEICSSR